MTSPETDLTRVNQVLLAHGFLPDADYEETWTKEGKGLKASAGFDSDYLMVHVMVRRKGSDDLVFEVYIDFEKSINAEIDLAFKAFEFP